MILRVRQQRRDGASHLGEPGLSYGRDCFERTGVDVACRANAAFYSELEQTIFGLLPRPERDVKGIASDEQVGDAIEVEVLQGISLGDVLLRSHGCYSPSNGLREYRDTSATEWREFFAQAANCRSSIKLNNSLVPREAGINSRWYRRAA